MLNEEKIILGSVNLHFRFGHVSSLQYLSSLFNNFVFNENGILIPLTIFFSTIVIYFYEEYRDNNNKFLKLYSIFSLIFILTSMNRYSGFGNDDPAHMLYLVAIFNFLKIIYVPDNEKNLFFKKLTYYTVNTFLIKQFYILILILPILVYFIYLKKINLQNKCNLFSTILISIWLLKNILVSGCVLYPANISCFQSLNWSPNGTLSNPIKVSIESEAWAKAWPDRSDKSIGLSEHISDYQWIDAWLKSHLKVVLKKLSPLTILSILFLIIIIFTIKEKNKLPLKRLLITIFYLHIFFSLVWFFKFPTYRYGAAYMGVSIILLSLLLINFYNIKEKTFKFLNISLIVICILVGFKNIKRIYENINITYVDYPWPKKNSFTQSNYINFNKPIYDNKKEIIYYEAYPYTLCMYSKGPCTSFRNLDLKRQIIFRNYKMYKFKK